MEPVIVNGVDISRELEAEFVRGWHAEAALAKIEQERAAALRARLPAARATELGRHLYNIHPFWFHYWGQREGYDIWSDHKEMERFARDTPEIRVPQERKAQVRGWRPALRKRVEVTS